jgi:hypothetical protein
VVPVTELVVKRGDLVVSTQGRSFWILDDLSPLHQLTDEVARAPFHLFEPRRAYRVPGSSPARPNIPNSGRNPPKGAILYYALSSEPREELAIEIRSASGDVVKRFSTKDEAAGSAKPETKIGLNRFVWDLRYEPPALTVDSPLREWYEVGVPRAVPGPYRIRLTVDGSSVERPLEVAPDPRLETTADEYRRQLDLALQIRDRLSLLTENVEKLRVVREQAKAVAGDAVRPFPAEAKAAASRMVERLDAIEGRLVEPRLRIPIDLIHFGPKLDLHLGDLLGVVVGPDAAPTEGARKRFVDLDAELTQSLEDLSAVFDKDVPALNALVRSQDLPLIAVPKP